jgi:hypothetical protein
MGKKSGFNPIVQCTKVDSEKAKFFKLSSGFSNGSNNSSSPTDIHGSKKKPPLKVKEQVREKIIIYKCCMLLSQTNTFYCFLVISIKTYNQNKYKIKSALLN